LAITREIVLAHGGGIKVADSNRGARLEVTLPAAATTSDARVEIAFDLPKQETAL
jgi:signal transduction histidine kinase